MKKKLYKALFPAGIIGAVFALGLFFGLNSWNKNLYVQWNPSQGRGIAGEDSLEILNLSSSQLTQKAGAILFSNNQVIREKGLTAFYLGNFLVQDPHLKQHRFICQLFPFVELSFSAVGITLSGEPGLMVLQSPCLMEDENFIGPFWIPHEKILTHPEQKSFELPEREIFIHFYHVSISLTHNWLLTNVRFFNKDNEENNELLIRFIPGKDKPYFEFSLKDTEATEEPVGKPIEEFNL